MWQTLVDEAGEEAVANVASATVSQAERDLAAAGSEVSAERARANANVEAPSPEPASVEKERQPASEALTVMHAAGPVVA